MSNEFIQSLQIILVKEPDGHVNTIRYLFKEYADELNENLCFQSFDEELANPLKKYGHPAGCLYLAFINEEPAGCIAYQSLKEPFTCEMKRLYVKPKFRKHGLGELLIKEIIHHAIEAGYRKMVLDTLQRLQPAISLYKRFGFVYSTAYYANPLDNVVYMEKNLLK